ncbi:amino acid/polyamine transporter I [Aspergillus multicolor]|uniref:amino acid/polyamine transporter I n=1 Tax=Aspergillus multicolor TaxID=41759 RepID=UPI003CCD6F40
MQDGLDQIPSSFGLWSAIGLGWLTLNAFGGISYILFVGLSAGGMPAIIYGFIGSSVGVICTTLTLAQCASRFSTAGGAYHYSCYLLPLRYRRQIGYPLGWLNYLGWIFTNAACCAIVASATLALINLCNPSFEVTTRWQMFLVYLCIVAICWMLNLWGLKSIPTVELVGCYITVLAFIAYTIVLLVKAPKADARSVFVEPNNHTGYASTSFAVFLGLFTSFSTLLSLEGPCHLAEELPTPKRTVPRIIMIVVLSQVVVGVVWLIVVGFCITDLDAINSTATGIPILELIRRATGSDAAAMGFAVMFMINNGTSALGSAVTMSRQGYTFARDGGLFWNSKLIERSSRTELPFWSINLPSFIVALIGLIYLFSNTAFNAIIGGQSICIIISLAFPALTLLLTGGELLPSSSRWNFGIWTKPIYLMTVGYSLLVALVAFSYLITALNMNYTVLVMSVTGIAMALAWALEGRKLYSPPLDAEAALVVTASTVIEGSAIPADISKDDPSRDVEASGHTKKVATKDIKGARAPNGSRKLQHMIL